MKVIIAGSRGIHDFRIVEKAILESGFSVSEVVSGAASGVDKLGEAWALIMNVPIHRFSANWALFGNRAGLLRNEEMVNYADALIAVWDGISRGTRFTIRCARQKGLKVFVLEVRR